MKIEAQQNSIVLKEVFSGVTIETTEGKKIHICQRDLGWDVKIENGEWHHLNDESDFIKKEEKLLTIDFNEENNCSYHPDCVF